MAITVKHKFVSAIPDAGDTTIVQPSNWNDDHTLTGTIPVANGGTGAATLTGYVYGNGTAAMTASTTIANTSITGLGTMSTQNANAVAITGGTISGVTLSGYIPYTGASSAIDLNAQTVTNISHLGINTTSVPTILMRAVGDNNSSSRIAVRGYSSDANSSAIRVTKFRGTVGAPQAPQSGDSLGKFELAGYGTTSSEGYPQASLEGLATEAWGATARGTKAVIKVTPNTTTTQVTALTIDQNSAATFASSVTATSFSGSGSGLTSIPNSALTNSSITINGTSTSLGGSISVGTVTSVTGTSPVVSSGGTTPAISMPAATTSVSGYLTSTDWNTFNSKGTGTVTSVSGTTGRITSTGGTTPIIDLASGVATAGTTGSSTLIPVVTIDTYGRVTSITTASNPQGTVTSVTGTAPVVSSGGATPAISMAAANTTTNGYLTSTDWNTFNGKGSGTVTSVAALTLGTTGTDLSSTVATGTTTPVITLQVPTASASNRGALSSTDWSTFNGKQAALVSGTNIKTVNGTTLLGTGDLGIITGTYGGTGVNNGATTITVAGNLTHTGAFTQSFTATANTAVTLPAGATAASNNLLSSATAVSIITGTPSSTTYLRGDGTWATISSSSGTVTSVSVVSANGFAGSVATATTTPAITISTSITGLLKGNGTAISAATSGTDYSAGTSALTTGILKSTTTTGALSIAVAADFPTLNQNTTGTASNVTGTVAIANGGSGQTTAQLAMNAFAGAVTSGSYLRGNGTNVVMSTIQAGDVPTLNQNTTGSAGSVTNSLTAGTGLTGSTFNGSAAVTWNATGTTINSQTTGYTLVAGDAGKTISTTTGGVTAPASVLAAGNIVTIYNNSASSQTITQGTSLTLQWAGQASSTTGNRTLGPYGIATLVYITSTNAIITGAGLT